MGKGLEELKRLAYENACCRCQYYTDNKCTNKDTCVWLEIETKLKDYEELEERIGFDPTIFKEDFETLMNKHKALERVKELCLEHDIHDTAELDNTLIAFEILKKDFESLRDFKYKQLDALEIIKEKEVNVFIFLHSGDLETYNDMVEDNRKLKQKEYDLLKEVFL